MSEGDIPPKSGGGSDASDPLDAVLKAWPTAPGHDETSEDSAARILARVASGPSTDLARGLPPISDVDLFRPPCPALPDEPQSSTPVASKSEPKAAGTAMTAASRERDRASFRDLARLANAGPSPAGPGSSAPSSREPLSRPEKTEREENSGVIHLTALGAGNVVAETPVTPGAPKPSPSRAVALAEATASVPSTRPSPQAPPGSGPTSRRINPGKKKRSWVGISSLVAVAAVAVGVLFGARQASHEDGSAAVAVNASPPQPASPATTAASAQPVLALASAPPGDRGVDPASLPPASTATGVAHGATVASAPALARPAVAASTRAPAPDLVAAVPTPAAAPSAGASLQTLMQQAAGVTSAPAAPVATGVEAPPSAVGSVPLRPSQGALQGALGAALPSARACLGPDDAISHATITFASDGSVVSVGISGGAAGKPAEGCIRAALTKARVAPFAQPTFTGTATVRPN